MSNRINPNAPKNLDLPKSAERGQVSPQFSASELIPGSDEGLLAMISGTALVAADGSDGVGDAPGFLDSHRQIDRSPAYSPPQAWELKAEQHGNHSVAADGSDGVGDAPSPDGSHRQIDYTE